VGPLGNRTADKDFICFHVSIYKIYMSGLFPVDPIFLFVPDDSCEIPCMKNDIIVVLLILIPVVYFQHDRIERITDPTETIQWGSVDFKDLVKTDGLYYKKYADVVFTGKTTGTIQGSFERGKKHGPWISYHNNGHLFRKGTYEDGNEVGPWVSYNEILGSVTMKTEPFWKNTPEPL
jgi:hypothetical protein